MTAPKPAKYPFGLWLSELSYIMGQWGYGFNQFSFLDKEAWRDYWEDGYSPEEAIREDLSYA